MTYFPINDLPNEIVMKILEDAGEPNATLVCKKWNGLLKLSPQSLEKERLRRHILAGADQLWPEEWNFLGGGLTCLALASFVLSPFRRELMGVSLLSFALVIGLCLIHDRAIAKAAEDSEKISRACQRATQLGYSGQQSRELSHAVRRMSHLLCGAPLVEGRWAHFREVKDSAESLANASLDPQD